MKGGCPTLIYIEEDRKAYKMPSDLWVNSKLDTMEFLKSSFGEENVKIKQDIGIELWEAVAITNENLQARAFLSAQFSVHSSQ